MTRFKTLHYLRFSILQFHSFCASFFHSSLCCFVQICSIRLNGFYWHYIWHVSPKHTWVTASLSINQNVNLGSTPSSLLLVPFCLPCVFPSPSTFHWLKSQILPPHSVFSTFLLSSSLSVPGARLALRLFNCHGLGRRKMKVEQVGEGRVGSGLESGVE